jgi:hypothetical protein
MLSVQDKHDLQVSSLLVYFSVLQHIHLVLIPSPIRSRGEQNHWMLIVVVLIESDAGPKL